MFRTAFLALIALAGTASAQGQSACGSPSLLIETLAKDYGETPVFAGQTEAGPVIVTVNDDKGTWTLLLARGPFLCIAMVGDGFSTVPVVHEEKAPDGEDA
jgi:hypothetical protein